MSPGLAYEAGARNSYGQSGIGPCFGVHAFWVTNHRYDVSERIVAESIWRIHRPLFPTGFSSA